MVRWDGVYVPTERAPAPDSPAGRRDVGDVPPVEDRDDEGGRPRTGSERGMDTMFVPTQRMRPGDTEFTVEMRTLVDGRLALLTYSSLESLVECCGPAQPWAEVPAERLEGLRAMVEAAVVLVDTPLEDEFRHTDPGGQV